MGTKKIILLIFGIIIVVGSLLFLVLPGGTFVWIDKTQIDDDGFISSDTVEIEKDSYAIICGPIQIGDKETIDTLEWMGMDTIKIEGTNNDSSEQVFIGIAKESDMENYLSNIEYDEITELNQFLSSADIDFENHSGDSVPAEPTTQEFWTTSVYGTGTQTLEWEPEEGDFWVVLMNSDASKNLDLDMTLYAKISHKILSIGIGLLLAGIVGIVIGIAMIYFAVRKSKSSDNTIPHAGIR